MGTLYQPPGYQSEQFRQILLVVNEVDGGGIETGRKEVLFRFTGAKGASIYNGACDIREDYNTVIGMIKAREEATEGLMKPRKKLEPGR